MVSFCLVLSSDSGLVRVAGAQSMSRSSRMLNYINYRMRVTIQDG